MKITVIRDEAYYNSLSQREKDDVFRKCLSIFKKAVTDSGVLQELKMREFNETPGQKRRRKKKESDAYRRNLEKKNNEKFL
jgi:ribosomal protein S21